MSLEIAVSGINAVSSQLDSISNNIANASSYGYKTGRTNFASLYVGSQAMGVGISSKTQDIARMGGMQSTGRLLDAAIDGSGFFITRGSDGSDQYTRVGMFNTDKDGFLVDGSARRVQGYAMNAANGALGALGDLKIPSGQIPAMASSALKYTGNLSTAWAQKDIALFNKDDPSTFNASTVSVVYDSRGDKHNLTQYFVRTGDNEVQVQYTLDGKPAGTPATLAFDANGQLENYTPSPLDLGTPTGAAPLTVNVDYSGTTLFAGESTTLANSVNGYASGVMTGVRIESNGELVAQYSNGQRMAVGVLAIANFPNEAGLSPVSGASWIDSPASGTAVVSVPGNGKAGVLAAGVLEGSNVDMTGELVKLMSAQRSYQANTKVITAESQAIQALMQAI
ncbi:flagellar hook-basal body complex protein [Rhodobacteraceae bacterium CH30]|nr:flagellar hook-basal body complex protein [Rhodobacteraceae bacterium CH30]